MLAIKSTDIYIKQIIGVTMKYYFIESILFSLIFFISGCSKEPGYVIKDFNNEGTWEEKKHLIYDSEGLNEKILEDNGYIYSNEIKNISLKGKISDSLQIIKVTVETKRGEKAKEYVIRFTDGKEKIDFKAMIGYNSPSLKEIKLQKIPKAILRLRIRLKDWNSVAKDNYYEWYANDFSGGDLFLIAEERNSPTGIKLYNLTKNGEEVEVSIKTKVILFLDVYTILGENELLKDSWL